MVNVTGNVEAQVFGVTDDQPDQHMYELACVFVIAELNLPIRCDVDASLRDRRTLQNSSRARQGGSGLARDKG